MEDFLYVVLKVHGIFNIDGPVAQLVRAPPCHGGGREFESLLGRLWDLSSAGRASALQAEGHRFEPYRPHYMDGFPSGQRGQTVNLLATPSKVRILLHPFRCEIHLLPVLTGQPMARRCGSIGRAADL